MRYSSQSVDRIAAAIRERIVHAVWDEQGWDAVSTALAEAFPGAFSAIQNVDFSRGVVNFDVTTALDPEYHASYNAHYLSINPWAEFWSKWQPGTIAVAERDSPAQLFRGTEFYEDWLTPLGDFEGAVGMKVDGGPNDLLHIVLHYPRTLTGRYDEPLARIMASIRGDMARAVRQARRINEAFNRQAADAALLDRLPDAAVVVDRRLRITAANDAAESAFSEGSLISPRGGQLGLADGQAEAAVRNAVERLIDGLPLEATHQTLAHGDRLSRVSFTLLPTMEGLVPGLLVPARRQVLLLFRDLSRPSETRNLQQVADHFGLTEAETALCRELAAGHALKDAAERLSVTQGTARQRLKLIFQKTETHRQGELMLLLSRYG